MPVLIKAKAVKKYYTGCIDGTPVFSSDGREAAIISEKDAASVVRHLNILLADTGETVNMEKTLWPKL